MSFVQIPRALRDHPLGGDPESLSLFIHLVINAAWKDQEMTFNGEKITLKRGQTIFGRTSYSQRTGLTEAALRRSIRRLKKWRLIGGQSSHRFTVITLLPSELWRGDVTESGTKNNIYINNNNITGKVGKNPTLPQVVNTIKAKKIRVDAEDFFNYYDARGWKLPSGQPIENWISLAYSWAKRDKAKAEPDSWEVVK
jgi:hypothetical protein